MPASDRDRRIAISRLIRAIILICELQAHNELQELRRAWAEVKRQREAERRKQVDEQPKLDLMAAIAERKLEERAVKFDDRTKVARQARGLRARAKVLGLPDAWTTEAAIFARRYFRNRCGYCNRAPQDEDPESALTWDHFIPLSDENSPGTVRTNLVPACHGCNQSKYGSEPETWVLATFGLDRGEHILWRVKTYFDKVK